MLKLKEDLKAALKRAEAIAKAATDEDREFTDDELAEIDTIDREVEDLKARIAKAEKSADTVRRLRESGEAAARENGTGDLDDAHRPAKAGSLGERFVKSAPFEAFKKAHPSGVGQGTPVQIDRVKIGDFADLKADTLTTEAGHIQNIRMPDVDQVYRPPLALLDLISRGQTAGNFEYMQFVAVERRAAIVPENTGDDATDTLKPISTLTTEIADAKVYTYADGYEVTNQLLADAPAIATYINTELNYSLSNLVEDKLLNGTGTNGEPRGIMNTTGVLSQDRDGDMFTTIRKAITKVTNVGGIVTAVLLSPEDDEAWDLAQDNQARYYGQGPFGSGPNTAWGRPRVVSQRLPQGTFILGNFATVAYLDREGVSIVAFNQHKDFAQRNLTYVRAELRGAQVVWKPAHLLVGDITEPAGG